MKYLTTTQVAARLGVSPRRVSALAKARGVAQPYRGLWNAADVKRLRPGKVGRPPAQRTAIARLGGRAKAGKRTEKR